MQVIQSGLRSPCFLPTLSPGMMTSFPPLPQQLSLWICHVRHLTPLPCWTVKYSARVKDAAEPFAASPTEGIEFTVRDGHMLKAFQAAVKTMKKGEHALLHIKPDCKDPYTPHLHIVCSLWPAMHGCIRVHVRQAHVCAASTCVRCKHMSDNPLIMPILRVCRAYL